LKLKKNVVVGTIVGVTALAFGCGSSTQLEPRPDALASQSVVAETGKVTETVKAAQSASPPVANLSQPIQTKAASNVEIGYTIGTHVPNFEINLDDGRTLTSEDLLSEGRPVFLFFTASW